MVDNGTWRPFRDSSTVASGYTSTRRGTSVVRRFRGAWLLVGSRTNTWDGFSPGPSIPRATKKEWM